MTSISCGRGTTPSLDEPGALIDHGIKAALEDLRVGDRAPRDAARGGVPGDELR